MPTAIGNDLRDLADQVDAALGGCSTSPAPWPTPVNLIGGTEPPPISLTMETDPSAEVMTYQDRRCENMLDGSVLFIGDSIVHGMQPNAAVRSSVLLGYGGGSLRRLLTHMKRPAFKSALQRAGGGFVWGGMNDAGNTAYYGSYAGAVDTVVLMFSSHLKNWITGPWVISKPLRGNGVVQPNLATVGYNAAADAIGDGIAAAFAGVPNVRVFDPNPLVIDSSGNLDAALCKNDGQHPIEACYEILYPAIDAEFAALGVPT